MIFRIWTNLNMVMKRGVVWLVEGEVKEEDTKPGLVSWNQCKEKSLFLRAMKVCSFGLT